MMLGPRLERIQGERPFGQEFSRTNFWAHLRGGVTSAGPVTILGSQFGFEYGARVGVGPSDRDDVFFAAGTTLQIAYRGLSFQGPVIGQLAVHMGLDLEFATKGRWWWNETAKLAPLIGARLAIAADANTGLELDYTLVPLTIGFTPDSLSVRRVEHRVALTIGAGDIGIGAWLILSPMRYQIDASGFRSTLERTVAIGMEWRQ